MTNRTRAKWIVAGGATLFCFLVLEAIVRLGLQRDADGNCKYRSLRLKPYHLGVHRAEEIIAKYQATNDSVLMYDSELGWKNRPGQRNHNSAGITTSAPEAALEKSPDRLRIALFGGSYTEGTYDKGWWRVLEETLNARGVKAEVLNFGVAAYAMDQAYLTWKRDGIRYHPDIVVFGFTAGNSYDNLSLLRLVRDPETGVPFSKPRFVLENGALRLLNSPTPEPLQVLSIMRNLAAWPLLPYEYYYHAGDFRLTPWRCSKLLAFGEAKIAALRQRQAMRAFYQPQGEGAQTSEAIVRQFAREAEESGSKFCIVHLAYHPELEDLRATGRFQFQEILDAMDQIAPTAHPEKTMLQVIGTGPAERFYVEGHYGEQFHRIVGEDLAEFIRKNAPTWRKP